MHEPNIRVLSYNIHKGFNLGNVRYVLSMIKQAIRSVDVDIIFLQEVIGSHVSHLKRTREWPTLSQFEYLADEFWPHHAYGRNAVYRKGDHGNAILSRYPIRAFKNYDISATQLAQRGILHAQIELPGSGRILNCMNVHLDLMHTARLRQVKQMCGLIGEWIEPHDPFVLAGDFNDWSQRLSSTIEQNVGAKEIFKHTRGSYAATYPARYPLLKLDRIYVRGLDTLAAQVMRGSPWATLSDHAPLFAELQFRQPAA